MFLFIFINVSRGFRVHTFKSLKGTMGRYLSKLYILMRLSDGVKRGGAARP